MGAFLMSRLSACVFARFIKIPEIRERIVAHVNRRRRRRFGIFNWHNPTALIHWFSEVVLCVLCRWNTHTQTTRSRRCRRRRCRWDWAPGHVSHICACYLWLYARTLIHLFNILYRFKLQTRFQAVLRSNTNRISWICSPREYWMHVFVLTTTSDRFPTASTVLSIRYLCIRFTGDTNNKSIMLQKSKCWNRLSVM